MKRNRNYLFYSDITTEVDVECKIEKNHLGEKVYSHTHIDIYLYKCS